jgi:hypothetical protein
MAKSDVAATTFKEKKSPKVVSHIEIHPNMKGGHSVHVVHTHPHDHPNIVKEFEGPHEGIDLPSGHILHHIAGHLGIPTKGIAAGTEENVSEKEGAEL